MEKELVTLSTREIERLRIIRKVMDRNMTQVEASEILGITDRQIRNIITKIKEKGDRGIAHRNRGRAAPNKMREELEARIGEIIKKKYADFRPTLASEKLLELHAIRVGQEKLRQIMMAKGIWRVRRRKKEVHQWRERKHYYGQMIQTDGSHHDWLEGREGLRWYLWDMLTTLQGRYLAVFTTMKAFSLRWTAWEGIYTSMGFLRVSTWINTALIRRPGSLIWQKFGTKVAELILGGKGNFFAEEARVCDLRRNNNRFQLYIK
jgi:transposase